MNNNKRRNKNVVFKLTELENQVSKKQHDKKHHYCDLCRVNVGQDYLEKHFYSKLHRSKLKDSGTHPDLTLEQEYCLPCNTVFSNRSLYEAHNKSKKHKRNARAHPVQVLETSGTAACNSAGAFSPRAMRISVPTLNGQVKKELFSRRKYKTRSNRVNSINYQNYIHTLTDFLSLRLALDTNVKDFDISVNDKRWHSFGDIVIDVTTINDKNTVYAIKCKQVSDSGKQIDSLSQAKIKMDKEYESLTSLKNIQEFALAKFLIFTNNTASSNFSCTESENTVEISEKTLNLWKTEKGSVPKGDTLLVKPSRRSDFIDVTSDPDNLFSINPKDENESYELPYVYFYTSQRVNLPMVNALLRKKFENFEISIHQQYSKYIEKWAEGELGGHYYLNKKDVILKIGEILLRSYIMLPKKIKYRHDNFNIWNQVISQVDLTILRKENHITSKICQPINQIIEKMLVKIDGVSRSVEITDTIVSAITDPGIRAYLFEEYDTSDKKLDIDKKSEIPINKIYNIFWKSDKIPLLLDSEKKNERDFILEVICFMKQYGVNRQFLLKSFKPLFDNRLRIFTCLDDVKDLVDLEKVGFTLSEEYLSLKTISSSDPFFLKWISPNCFFDMVLGKYMIKKCNKNNNELTHDLKMILDDETIRKLLVNLYGDNDESLNGIENEGRLKGINPLWF